MREVNGVRGSGLHRVLGENLQRLGAGALDESLMRTLAPAGPERQNRQSHDPYRGDSLR